MYCNLICISASKTSMFVISSGSNLSISFGQRMLHLDVLVLFSGLVLVQLHCFLIQYVPCHKDKFLYLVLLNQRKSIVGIGA